MNKKNISSFSSFALVIVFFVIGFFLINQPVKNLSPENIKYVRLTGANIKVDLALTDAERQKGLGGRNELKTNEGMLFVLEHPGKYYFWMKGMNFPIDIVWITEDMKVIYIKKDAWPESYPETFGPDINAKYILEINAGFSDKNNLKEGDRVLFVY